MKATVRLERIVVNDEADGSGGAEPFLWPVFFKIDQDILGGTYLDLRREMPLESISWLRAPGGAHNNLPGGVRQIDIPSALGQCTFALDPGELIPTKSALVACIVVLLEEDHFPSDSDIRGHYRDFATEISTRVRKEVKAAFDAAIGGLPATPGERSPLHASTVESEISARLKDKLDHWLVDVDDFIGVKFLKWSFDDLVIDSRRSFSVRWNRRTGSEDGDFTLSGRVEASEVPEAVVIHELRDYEGRSQPLAPGRYDVDKLSFGNNALSALKVPPGWKVTLYRHGGFTGETRIVTDNKAYIGDDFNNKTSSIVVEGSASIHQLANYNGASQRLAPGRYDLGALTIGNDAVSSVRVPMGWKVTLYRHSRFTGTTKVLTGNVPNLDDFDNRTSSIVVES